MKNTISQFTNAPLRVKSVGIVSKSITQVFDNLKNHEKMTEWVPMMKKVEMSHTHSSSIDVCDVGSVRVCHFGNDKLIEEIKVWDPPFRYAYSANDTKDASDHLGVIECEELGPDQTKVTWSQYFNPTNPIKGFVMNIIMKRVLNKAIKNLSKI